MKLKKDHWHIAFKMENEKKFHLLRNTLFYWVADPFLYKYKGEWYLFAELFYYKKNKGVIGYSKFSNGKFEPWEIALEEPWHLSFPYIVEYNGKIYMCPEGYERGNYYAYESGDFPKVWKKVGNIMEDGSLYVDCHFSCIKEMVYFFAYKMNPENHQAGILSLYYLRDKTFYELQKIDTRYPRAGGAIFQSGDKLIRTAQDCEGDYGKGLVFFEITLRENLYQEKLIEKIYADMIEIDSEKKFCGIHTYNVCEGMQVIDLKTKDINIVEIFYRIVRKIKLICGK